MMSHRFIVCLGRPGRGGGGAVGEKVVTTGRPFFPLSKEALSDGRSVRREYWLPDNSSRSSSSSGGCSGSIPTSRASSSASADASACDDAHTVAAEQLWSSHASTDLLPTATRLLLMMLLLMLLLLMGLKLRLLLIMGLRRSYWGVAPSNNGLLLSELGTVTADAGGGGAGASIWCDHSV